jgi:putative inorganic carbon (HCO3(-)) transporter
MNLAYLGVALLAVVTALGTYERSAVIGLAVLGCYMFLRSRRKFLFAIIGGIAMAASVYGTASKWDARVSTIGEYATEGSALTRLMVWKWTLDYVEAHPLGGGFDAYVVNVIILPPDAGNPNGSVQNGRAWHSIYFEMLGELGWPGLLMFLLAAVSSLYSLLRLSLKCRKIPDLVWVADMSDAVQIGMAVFLTAGAFVGIAFQPPFWYFVSMGISLRAYVRHAERITVEDTPGWRRVARHTREALLLGATPGSRPPPILPGDEPVRAPGWPGRAQLRRGEH